MFHHSAPQLDSRWQPRRPTLR